MNIIILDDDKEILSNIKNKISNLCSEYVIEEYSDSFCLLNKIKYVQNSIILLNLAIEKNNGINISNVINETNSSLPIIFYSNSNLNIDVYEGHHTYYLTYPFDDNLLIKAISIAKTKLDKMFFSFTFAKINYKMPLDLIYYFESNARTIKIVTEYETKVFYGKLDAIEEKISKTFIRASKSYLINPKYILRITDNKIIVKKGISHSSETEITITKNYRKKVFAI